MKLSSITGRNFNLERKPDDRLADYQKTESAMLKVAGFATMALFGTLAVLGALVFLAGAKVTLPVSLIVGLLFGTWTVVTGGALGNDKVSRWYHGIEKGASGDFAKLTEAQKKV